MMKKHLDFCVKYYLKTKAKFKVRIEPTHCDQTTSFAISSVDSNAAYSEYVLRKTFADPGDIRG